MNRAEMKEWLRHRLGQTTPMDRGIPDAQPGDAPPWHPFPTNVLLDDVIRSGARRVNREVGITDAGGNVSLSVAAQTADGPYAIELSSLEGVGGRQVTGIRRAWWNDGSTVQPLESVTLRGLDLEEDNYQDAAAGTPVRFAIEGYRFHLMPAPSAAGTLLLAVATGVFEPQTDLDGFSGIPEIYDESVLYNVLVELSLIPTDDTEMQKRAAAYTPLAREGVEHIKEWYPSSNEDLEPAWTIDIGRRSWRR